MNAPKNKLVLAWVDMDGFELTGRYRDTLMTQPETSAIPVAKAARFSDNTPARREQLLTHITQEQTNHLWMGWFLLPDTVDLLAVARAKAMQAYQAKFTKK